MMDLTVKSLSNGRLEQEIAALYWEAYRAAPGTHLKEEGVLGALWEEFDRRLAAGGISSETDWEPKEWREGYYE